MAVVGSRRFIPYRILVDKGGDAFEVPKLAYEADDNIDVRNEQIRRVFVSLHGTGGDAQLYYNNGTHSVAAREATDPGTTAETFVVAPQFPRLDELAGAIPSDLLYWGGGRASGYPSGDDPAQPRAFQIRSFDAMDALIRHLCRAEIFPNLKIIVIAGHSNGGRFMSRYAATNAVEDRIAKPRGIHMRYLVMGAGSFLYMDSDRYRFANDSYKQAAVNEDWRSAIEPLPQTQFNTICSTDSDRFDNWPNGLNSLTNYPNQLGRDRIRDQFGKRDVIYVVGENDLSTSFTECPERVQGPDTLAKTLLYKHHIETFYGGSAPHRLCVVAGVDHDGHDEMTSPEGLAEIFRARPAIAEEGFMPDYSDLSTVYGRLSRLQVEQVGARAQLRCSLTVEDSPPASNFFAYLDGSDAAVVSNQLDVLRDAFVHRLRVRLLYNPDEGENWKRFYDVRVYRDG